MSTLAIFGAGTGLGRSVARRFGADGRSVALVGRSAATLDAVAAELRGDGVAATSYLADLQDPAAAVDVAQAIAHDLGPIEIFEYAPISTAPFVPAIDLTLDALDRTLDLYVRTPVSVIRTVLPSMLESGRGIVLVGHGASALHPQPGMSGVGPAMAAMRNYLHSLHGEVADRGVYVGTLVVNALIEGSAGHRAITAGDLPVGMDVDSIPTVHPDALAERYWTMSRERTAIELLAP